MGTFPYRILSDISVDRNFDISKDSILEASKATCLLFIQSTDSKGHLDWEFATAFFVAPNLLLTAGHNALNPRDAVKIERWLFSPGTPHLNIDQIASQEPWAIRCSVVENMYKPGEISKDIAILSSENFVVKHYLKISTDPVPENVTIDIVGYPGEKRRKWLREKHPQLDSLVVSEAAGEKLLPTGTLVVTRGVVAESRMDVTSYTISTCPGLSGGCVIYNGKVHGRSIMVLQLIRGVHVGDSVLNMRVPKELRSAVSFQSEDAKKLLRRHKLT